jgi:hypothetical protein
MNELTTVSSTPLVPSDMDQAIRLAKAMSTAKMLPKHLWDDIGTCLMIIEQAMRWRMSPFAVAQCTSSIGGKLMFEGKLVAAAVEASGAIEGQFDYEFKGEGDDRQVTVSARRRGETNPRQMTIRLRDVRTANEHWKKQPDQMLVYSSTRNWARRFTPAVILGVYSPEEFSRDAEPPFSGTTLDQQPEPQVATSALNPYQTQQGQQAVAAAMPRGARIAEKAPQYEGPQDAPRKRQTIAEWLEAHRIALGDAQSADEVDRILEGEEMQRARETFKNGAKTQLDAMITEAIKRWYREPPEAEGEEPLEDIATMALP